MADPISSGFVPEEYMDEVTPPPRPSPDAWLLKTADGAWHLAAEDDEAEGDVAGPPLADGDVVTFGRNRVWPRFTLTVTEDGHRTSEPVDPGCTLFCVPGDPDTLSLDLSELAAILRDDAETESLVDGYDWSDPIPFLFKVGSDGAARFEPIGSA